MATKRFLEDPDFGIVIVRSHRNSINISLRIKDNQLIITVPPYAKKNQIIDAINKFRTPLLEKFQKTQEKNIDTDYKINTPYFCLKISYWKGHYFRLNYKDNPIVLECPKETDFSSKNVKSLISSGIIRAMKRQASIILPPIVQEYALRFDKKFKKIKITGAKSRWGSCSNAGTISLSCYLVLLPPHLVDYVILHELAHTVEMNHSDRFWELLDNMTDGKSKSLRSELRKFKTDF